MTLSSNKTGLQRGHAPLPGCGAEPHKRRQAMKGTMLFLGTGGSVGVPMVGCSCAVCTSRDPHNERLRTSALLTLGKRQFLVDAGPDVRQQALKFGINHLDGLLLTHAHHDHTAGMDDLRPLSFETPLPVLASVETANDVKERFHYLFPSSGSDKKPHFEFHLIHGTAGEAVLADQTFQYVTYSQGGMAVNGWRVGNFAYLSDMRNYSLSLFDELQGVEVLVISALKFIPSPLHFSIDEAVDFANRLGVKEAYLTHLSHEIDTPHANAYLPPHVRIAYDGLTIHFNY